MWPDRDLQCYNTHNSLATKRYWLEVSKKVKHNLVHQGTSELKAEDLEVTENSVSMYSEVPNNHIGMAIYLPTIFI